MKEIIKAEDLCFRYEGDAIPAVEGVSLTIGQGEFVAVLGHNGSGKSTLAKLFNALYLPTGGTLTVCGLSTREEANMWQVRQKCGMVFQNPDNQLVATIVEEDVAFGLENLGLPSGEIRRRVDEALALVGMSSFAQAAPHMLSGGQKQRVAIAGVVAMRPDILVFDESTAMLDPLGRAEVLKVVRQLNREEGITVVWITHFMEEAAQADRLLVMDRGRVVLSGRPREVFEQAEAIKAYGLEVPEMMELSHQLRAAGVALPQGILNVEEMVVELCRLCSTN